MIHEHLSGKTSGNRRPRSPEFIAHMSTVMLAKWQDPVWSATQRALIATTHATRYRSVEEIAHRVASGRRGWAKRAVREAGLPLWTANLDRALDLREKLCGHAEVVARLRGGK